MADRPKVQIVRPDGYGDVEFYVNGKCVDGVAASEPAIVANAISVARSVAEALGADVEDAEDAAEPDAQPYVYRLAWHARGSYGSCWHTRSTPIEDEAGEADARASVARDGGITAPIVFLSIEYIDGPC